MDPTDQMISQARPILESLSGAKADAENWEEVGTGSAKCVWLNFEALEGADLDAVRDHVRGALRREGLISMFHLAKWSQSFKRLKVQVFKDLDHYVAVLEARIYDAHLRCISADCWEDASRARANLKRLEAQRDAALEHLAAAA